MTHGKTTFEDDPGQQLLRIAGQGRLAQGGVSWERNANVGNVPTIISACDSDLVRNRILQTHMSEKKSCNTNRRDNVARLSRDEL